jgi:hypothetical protein
MNWLRPRQFQGLRGRWNRNRTGTLRFWSLPPFVQQRSGKYTSTLEIAHFDGPKYQEAHQRSPALESKIEAKAAWRCFYYPLTCVGEQVMCA